MFSKFFSLFGTNMNAIVSRCVLSVFRFGGGSGGGSGGGNGGGIGGGGSGVGGGRGIC